MRTTECFVCGATIINKNHIGLNKKLLGRKIVRFYCINCMAEYFDITTEELLDKIEDFKNYGCKLFG